MEKVPSASNLLVLKMEVVFKEVWTASVVKLLYIDTVLIIFSIYRFGRKLPVCEDLMEAVDYVHFKLIPSELLNLYKSCY